MVSSYVIPRSNVHDRCTVIKHGDENISVFEKENCVSIVRSKNDGARFSVIVHRELVGPLGELLTDIARTL